jgi:hypothetical protein
MSALLYVLLVAMFMVAFNGGVRAAVDCKVGGDAETACLDGMLSQADCMGKSPTPTGVCDCAKKGSNQVKGESIE